MMMYEELEKKQELEQRERELKEKENEVERARRQVEEDFKNAAKQKEAKERVMEGGREIEVIVCTLQMTI